MKAIVLFLTTLTCFAQTYKATEGMIDSVRVLRLTDKAHDTEVMIAPSVGNLAYEMKVKGQNIFWFPTDIAAFSSNPMQAANIFLAPWANRFDQDAFWANGKKYILNPELKNFRRDPDGRPIHGLLAFSRDWEVVALRADDSGAEAVSRLEFWRHPDLMAQFPFAHTVEMTYRLSNGALEVRTRFENHSKEPMPLLIGYHPYFRVPDSPRDRWKVHVAARDHVELGKDNLPTGERKPVSLADPQPLAGAEIDDVFDNLIRGKNGRAEFWVEGKAQRITVAYGPKYNTAIVYVPTGKDFICFEPMTGVTNAFNLAHDGLYKGLQSIPPAGKWEESYWVIPSGF
jgi:aldose 1-epimerase